MNAIATQNLEQTISALTQGKTTNFSAGEVVDIVEQILASFGKGMDQRNLGMLNDLKALARTIQKVRDDMHNVETGDLKHKDLPGAHDELGAVVKATEAATNTILESTENIQKLTATLPDDIKAKIFEETTRIFEASNFQDITGQRITKVVKTLQKVEQKVADMLKTLGIDMNLIKPSEDKKPETDADLLHGPQLENKAMSQDDIDALLNSF